MCNASMACSDILRIKSMILWDKKVPVDATIFITNTDILKVKQMHGTVPQMKYLFTDVHGNNVVNFDANACLFSFYNF